MAGGGWGKRARAFSFFGFVLLSLGGGGAPRGHPCGGEMGSPMARRRRRFFRVFFHARSWSTWSAVGNLTSRAGGLRSTPSGPDDWHRVAGKRALALGGARSQGHNTGVSQRGLALRFGCPLAAERPLYSRS